MATNIATRVDAALTFDHVTFAYRGDPVVQDVSLTVANGEMLGLIGPNGAGKSTMLKLALGALRPAKGAILLHGTPLRSLPQQEIARRVAVVPQDFSVQFAYTVRQIVEMGRTPYLGALGFPRATDRDAVLSALAETDTLALADRVFNELSGGERQRVLLALALAQSTDVVLLDEPTAHLDIKHQIETLELVRRLNAERHMTVLAVLHDLNLAARYFSRLALFRRQIVAEGPPARVLDSALLSHVYETVVQVGILRGEEHLSVLPPGHASAPHISENNESAQAIPDIPAQVHVIAGGGSGELLMRALADAHIPFTAGPLNVGDSDHTLAQRLARLCIAEPPYAPISFQGLVAASEHIAAAGATILCPAPFGAGNIALIEAALAARSAGARVIILEPGYDSSEPGEMPASVLASIEDRDFSGKARALYEALDATGAEWVGSSNEAVALLQRAAATM